MRGAPESGPSAGGRSVTRPPPTPANGVVDAADG
jgi:hypothetical protein